MVSSCPGKLEKKGGADNDHIKRIRRRKTEYSKDQEDGNMSKKKGGYNHVAQEETSPQPCK